MKKNFQNDLKYLKNLLRNKRFELNMSQEEISEIIGCHPNAYGRIERGDAIPSYIMILKIAKALQISPKDLMPD